VDWVVERWGLGGGAGWDGLGIHLLQRVNGLSGLNELIGLKGLKSVRAAFFGGKNFSFEML